MLKNSFLGRRDEPVSAPTVNTRATPDAPRYAPQPDAQPLSAIAVTPPVNTPAKTSPPVTATSPSELDPTATQTVGTPRLTVGPNIKLKGAEINDCDTLVVEGHVEASMDSKTLEILKTGSYEGTVTIDIAEIHGKFSGNLTARKKLIVHASGWVSGVVRYGSLLVSEGGVVSGDIASIGGVDGKSDAQSALFAGYPSARIAGSASAVAGTTPAQGRANGADHHAAA